MSTQSHDHQISTTIETIPGKRAAKKQLTITGFCDEKIPEYVFGDELRVRQILTHLSFNAVKYTDSGRVDISASLKTRTEDAIVVRFTVIDTGIGISASDQRRIFQAFDQAADTTKLVKGGTGLGLTIAKELVKLMRGEIGVISEPGSGSTFWFEIPFSSGHD
jgi:signal transduction histidine kinase